MAKRHRMIIFLIHFSSQIQDCIHIFNFFISFAKASDIPLAMDYNLKPIESTKIPKKIGKRKNIVKILEKICENQ